MLRLLRNFIPVLALSFLLGCSFWEQPIKSPTRHLRGTPSASVSPTATRGENLPQGGTPASDAAQTRQPIPTASVVRFQTVTLTPTITQTLRASRTPTLTPTITSTPTLNPKAILLRIAEPGPMSKVTSPIEFIFYISPDFVGNTRIELIGEDGRSLYTKAFRTFATEGSTKVSEKIKFELPGTAEVARLQVSTSDKLGHMLAFNSVRLILLSVGETQLNPPFPALEHVLLRTPKWDDEISNGLLNIEGEIQPVNDQPVTVELFDQAGTLLGSKLLTFKPTGGAYQPFNTGIAYHVDAKVLARLVIRQDDDRINGLAYFYSREITLNP